MEKLVLTPEQLYFLGKSLNGRYIDYAYIAAMSDIGQRKALFEQECRESLKEAGVLKEDFWENLSVNEEAEKLLSPIFFGGFEAEIISEKALIRLHQNGGERSMTIMDEGKITITSLSDEGLSELLRQTMEAGATAVQNIEGEAKSFPVFDRASFEEALRLLKEEE